MYIKKLDFALSIFEANLFFKTKDLSYTLLMNDSFDTERIKRILRV